MARVSELTGGQPWLVNAIGYHLCSRDPLTRDPRVTITEEQVDAAREVLVQRRDTHLDQLADKLLEPRVRRVIEPLLSGGLLERGASEDDIQYALDLGLIARGPAGLAIANPIYREIIPRQLTLTQQMNLEARF